MSTTLLPPPRTPGVITALLVRFLATRPGAAVARKLYALRYTARDGRRITLVVAAAHDADRLLVVVGNAAAKTSTASPPTSSALWRRWFTQVALGEFVGFVAPAVVGAVSTTWSLPAAAAALLLAGAVEGSALAAVLAYALGLIPMALGERLAALPVAVLVAGGVVGGACLLATIGTAQWLVLRTVRPRSAWWIATTAGAWAAGLLVFTTVTTPLWQPGQALPLIIAIGVLGGLVMAATVAGLTGAAAVRLLGLPANSAVGAKS